MSERLTTRTRTARGKEGHGRAAGNTDDDDNDSSNTDNSIPHALVPHPSYHSYRSHRSGHSHHSHSSTINHSLRTHTHASLTPAMVLLEPRRVLSAHNPTTGLAEVFDDTLPPASGESGYSNTIAYVQKTLVADPKEAVGGKDLKPDVMFMQSTGVSVGWLGE